MSVVFFLVRRAATNEIRRRHVVFVPRVCDLTAGQVEAKDHQRIGVLVGHQQILSRGVELKVSRCRSARMNVADLYKFSFPRTVRYDAEASNGLMAAVAHQHKATGLVHDNVTTCIHDGRKRAGDGADGLKQTQRRPTLVLAGILRILQLPQ